MLLVSGLVWISLFSGIIRHDVPVGATPISPPTKSSIASKGVLQRKLYRLVRDRGAIEEQNDDHLKIAGENRVDSAGGYSYNGMKSILYCDFDPPVSDAAAKDLSDQPCDLEYITTGGDSGGGAFIVEGDKVFLVGIVKGGGVDLDIFEKSGYYHQVIEYTRVASFANWIKERIK